MNNSRNSFGRTHNYRQFQPPASFMSLFSSPFPVTVVFAASATADTLTSGGNHDGTILLSQSDIWSFTANTGDSIVLRGAALTSTNTFNPWLRIYGPDGVLIADSGSND